MKIVIPDEEGTNVNYLAMITGIGIFFFAMLGLYTYQSIPNVEINPFLLLSITIIPMVMAGYFTKIYVQSRSIHVIAPGGHFWSTIMLNVKTVVLPIATRDSKSVFVHWLVIPLGGGVIPNWLPYFGGGKNGFLVANKRLVIDLGGNIFVAGNIVKLTVKDLDPTLRKEIYNHKLFKGNPDKIPIYYSVLSWKVKDSDLDRPRINNEDSKLTTVGEVIHAYISRVRRAKHLMENVVSEMAKERAHRDIANRKLMTTSNRENENNNPERPRV